MSTTHSRNSPRTRTTSLMPPPIPGPIHRLWPTPLTTTLAHRQGVPMKKLLLSLSALCLLWTFTARTSLADPVLQGVLFNVNGTQSSDFSDPNFNTSGFNPSTGLGTLVYTYNPGTTGSAFFDAWVNHDIGIPYYNEYGPASGSPAAGQSWEIGDNYASSIYADTQNNALSNTNYLPQGNDNFLGSCNAANCNGDATMAMGFAFTLGSNQQELITLTFGTTQPTSGFYLDQTHPTDAANLNQSDIFFSASAVTEPAGSGPPPPPPPSVPEPSTWALLATGIGAGLTQLRKRMSIPSSRKYLGLFACAAALLLVPVARAATPTVSTVPWDPANPAAPHTAYPGANIVLGATTNLQGSSDPFTYAWNFGDGNTTAAAAVTNPNNIAARHIYAGTTIGQTWTAVVTVIDTITHEQATGNYLVIWEPNNLSSRVNVAIDLGLWYMHASMSHPSATAGNWDSCYPGYSFDCSGYGSITAANVQAFEVNGHTAAGPATDPYTSDVQLGLNQMFTRLSSYNTSAKTYNYNPALVTFGCSDGSAPPCTLPATKVFYNPAATSCSTPPCSFTFDSNANGHYILAPQAYPMYEGGQYIDAIVASGTPNAVATTGGSGVSGLTYKNIVQDMADGIAYCQYNFAHDYTDGYTRGAYPYEGGGWWYSCQAGDDNSVSQWSAIGLIGADRGFAVPIPPMVTDANNVWVTNSQDVVITTKPIGTNPWATGMDYGAFGYNGALNYSDAWGSFAVTPSGMVQMAMDSVGRSQNVAFGDASTDPDQRWNNAETYYADNFCNNPANGAYNSPRAYTYGMFSFTKAMLLHNPAGSLTPITYLRTQTPGVFTGNNTVPANTIDWYSALSAANGGSDPCDGIAQTIVGRQSAAGYWSGDNYSGSQFPYETAWSLIMLKRTVFVACVNNLGGRGTPSTPLQPARIDLTWTGIPNVTGYNVLRSSASGGPYAQIGTTTVPAYSDRTGLLNQHTYFYVLQPVNASGAEVCQSNQATVTVPIGR